MPLYCSSHSLSSDSRARVRGGKCAMISEGAKSLLSTFQQKGSFTNYVDKTFGFS